MANFDAAVGVTQSAMNGLIGQYFSAPPASDNPFQGSKNENVANFGQVTISWDITTAPTLAFGPPTQAVWDAALDSQGVTNKFAGNPLPTTNVVQVTIPAMSAYYQGSTVPKVGGDTANVIGYVAVTFSGNDITLTPVAITLDQSSFSSWDKLVFNAGFLPNIFSTIQSMLSVIHVPALTWSGISLNTPQFVFEGELLIAAATQTTNTSPLDIAGVTWPSDDLFTLASQTLLNNAIQSFVSSYQGKTFSNSGEYKNLATWEYDAVVKSITAGISTLNPLAISAALQAGLTVGAGLTPAGMALAAVGCALGGAGLLT